MTPTTNHPNFTLKKGVKYTICNPSAKCDGTETLGETQDNYIVDLVVQYDPDGKPDSATAYMPNQAACLSRGLPNTPECQLDLLFEDEQLVQLISTFKEPVKETGNAKPPQLVGVGGNQAPPPPPQPNTAYAIGLIAASCVAVIIAIMVRQLRKRNATLNSIVRAGSQKQNTVMPLRASSVQAQASDLNVSSLSGNNRSATRLAQPDTDQKIEEILSRLDSLEQQMVSILMKTSIKSEQMDESG
jgi:hypothetical protein